MGNREDTFNRRLDEPCELLGKTVMPRATEHGPAWRSLVQGELVGIEAEYAGTLDFGEILVKLLGREDSEVLVVERPHHWFIPVASVLLSIDDFVDFTSLKSNARTTGQEIRVFVDRFRGLSFEPPDRRLELGYLL